MRFTSPEAAYEQGMGAFKAGEPELAIQALEYAADRNVFLAKYYLARVLSVANGPHVDHRRAYDIYREIVSKYRDVDPYLDYRAPFVARAFHELALYARFGNDDAGMVRDEERARRLLEYAASYFDDPSAQFELAKMNLSGGGDEAVRASGKHWLSTLAKKGHAGAQAFLADLFWRGKYLPQKPITALALITMARENASSGDRIWVEEIHHQIFCGTAPGIRKQAGGMVMKWRRRFRSDLSARHASDEFVASGRAIRACANGELLQAGSPGADLSSEKIWRDVDQATKGATSGQSGALRVDSWKTNETRARADGDLVDSKTVHTQTRVPSTSFGSAMGLGIKGGREKKR